MLAAVLCACALSLAALAATPALAAPVGASFAAAGGSASALEDHGSFWPGYKGDGTGVVRGVATPTAGARAAWAEARKTTEMFVNASDAITVNDADGSFCVFDAARSTLYRRDPETGAVTGTAGLAESVNSTARLRYADGMILIPLARGRVQAVSARTLETLWVSDALPAIGGSEQQSLATMTVLDGCAYVETVAPAGMGTAGGFLLCLDLADGSCIWKQEDDEAGYYWTDAVPWQGGLLTVDDAGMVRLRSADDGSEIAAACSLGHASRANITLSADGTRAYVVTTDGVLHEVALEERDGGRALAELRSVRFGSYSTCTPTLCDGKLYVGGSSLASMRRGALFVIDAQTLAVEHEALVPASAGGVTVQGDVKSAPLVSVTPAGTYAYFTCNSEPGAVYAYRAGDDAASVLFVPAEASQRGYCISSVSCDREGALYYFNDSGTLFRLVAAPGDRGAVAAGQSGEPAGPAAPGQAGTSGAEAQGPAGPAGPAGGGSAEAQASRKESSGSASRKAASGSSSAPAASTAPAPAAGASSPGASGSADDGSGSADAGTEASADEPGAVDDAGDEAEGLAADAPDDPDAGARDDAGAVPVWPFVGIGVGVAILLALGWSWLRPRIHEKTEATGGMSRS